jgi:hypothetical protein
MNNFLLNRETRDVAKLLTELNEGIRRNEDLATLATRMTHLGLHTIWLGQEKDDRGFRELGDHLYRLGGDLQAIANSRL